MKLPKRFDVTVDVGYGHCSGVDVRVFCPMPIKAIIKPKEFRTDKDEIQWNFVEHYAVYNSKHRVDPVSVERDALMAVGGALRNVGKVMMECAEKCDWSDKGPKDEAVALIKRALKALE